VPLAKSQGAEFRGFPRDRHGSVVLAFIDCQHGLTLQAHDQVLHIDGGALTQHGHDLVQLRTGFGGSAAVPVDLRHHHSGAQRLGVAGIERFAGRFYGLEQHGLGGVEVFETHQARSDHVEQFDPQFGAQGAAAVDLGLGLLQQVDGRQSIAGPQVRIHVFEYGRDEFLDLLGTLLLRQRNPRLPDGDRRSGEHGESDCSGSADCQSVASHELGQAVPAAVRLRQHWPITKVALDVVNERMHGRIPFFGLLLERLGDDGVEIAFQKLAQSLVRHLARPRRFRLQNRLFQRTARIALQLVRPGAAEQLIQNHAQRVHVRCGGERLAEDLFGRCVVRRERAPGKSGELGFLRLSFLQQLRNAEVQQAHLARGGNQDVRRLQVAVHDEIPMRVRDCIRHLREQPQARIHIELSIAAMLVDGLAFNVLEREIRLAIRSETRIVQMRNIRVIQRRENFPLARHPLRQAGSAPDSMRQFERNRATDEAVGALRQPDRAHAAATEFTYQSVRTDNVSRLVDAGAGLRQLAVNEFQFRQGVEEAVGLDLPGSCQQLAQMRLERIEPRSEGADPLLALRGRLIERCIQQLAQLRPGIRIDSQLLHGIPIGPGPGVQCLPDTHGPPYTPPCTGRQRSNPRWKKYP
jgi:hypothetical protein